MRILLTAALMLFGSAMASTLTLTWTVPTERVNGDPLPASEISHYSLRCAPVGGGDHTFMDIPSTADGGIYEGQMSGVFPGYGDYECELATVDTWGLSSDYVLAQNGPIEYRPAAPGVPTNVLILVE